MRAQKLQCIYRHAIELNFLNISYRIVIDPVNRIILRSKALGYLIVWGMCLSSIPSSHASSIMMMNEGYKRAFFTQHALNSGLQRYQERWVVELKKTKTFSDFQQQAQSTDIDIDMLFELRSQKRNTFVFKASIHHDVPTVIPNRLPRDIIQEHLLPLLKGKAVTAIYPDIKVYPQLRVNDPFLPYQWSLGESQGGIRAPLAWNWSTGQGVTVAVLDTGYTQHIDLIGNILETGYDFVSDVFIGHDGDGRDSDARDPGDGDENNACGLGVTSSSWHGTHVMGVIAAEADNSIGIAGISFDSQILPVRVLGRCGGYLSDIADAVVWSAGGLIPGVPSNTYPAQVINLSLGGRGRCLPYMQSAIDIANRLGATVVTAAGNEGRLASRATPGNCRGVVNVGAINAQGKRAYYSNFGLSVDLVGPGGEASIDAFQGILSTVNAGVFGPERDAYGFYTGTSMSALHVSGVAALLYGLYPQADYRWIKKALMESARPTHFGCRGCGAGIVDAANAIQWGLNHENENSLE